MTDIILNTKLEVELIDHMGNDLRFAFAARVSTRGAVEGDDAAWHEANQGCDKLIGRLIKDRHGSPFEHGAMTFRVKAPIKVFREFHRHRVGWSYNEESGRYKKLKPEFYVPGPHRPLVQTGSAMSYTYEAGDPALHDRVVFGASNMYQRAYGEYEQLLEAGVTREVARDVLPVSIYSSMYATCNPRSLMHFLGLRAAPQAMYEIRMVAEAMELVFARLFPVTHGAWNANGRVAP